jgi:hypothetical protein
VIVSQFQRLQPRYHSLKVGGARGVVTERTNSDGGVEATGGVAKERLESAGGVGVARGVANECIDSTGGVSRRSIQSQADSGLPTQRIPVAFRHVNHTFLYLYPRDT